MPKIKLKLSYVISSFVIGIGSIIATGNIVHIDEMYKFYLTYVPIAFATAFSLIVARIKKGMS
jgi:hypothetical protein